MKFGRFDEEFHFPFPEIMWDVLQPRWGKKKKKTCCPASIQASVSSTGGNSLQGQQPVAEQFDVLDGDGIIFLSPILSAAIISPSQRDDAC